MAKNYKSFKLDPYPCVLRVFTDKEAFCKSVGADCSGMSAVTYRKNGLFAVFVPASDSGDVDIRLLAHEAYHVTDWLMEYTELEYKYNSGNEHVAYLVGHISGLIYDAAKALAKQKIETAK